MATVGERLRHEREIRDKTIAEIGEATGIGVNYLEALERDDFNALPGRAFGKLYIRAYAEALQFDPQPLLDDYDREQRLVPGEGRQAHWRPEPPAAREKPDVAPVATAIKEDAPPAAAARTPSSKRRLAAIVLIGVVAIAASIYLGLRRAGNGLKPALPTIEHSVVPLAPTPLPSPPQVTEPSPAPPPPAKAPGRLSVSESGMGRRVVHSHLEGESDRFAPGDVAWFQTRVLGGRGGEVIRHVWIFDGFAQESITLRLGGSDWRTHSNKTLYKQGAWTVEARDDTGRVLASAAFTCGPGGH